MSRVHLFYFLMHFLHACMLLETTGILVQVVEASMHYKLFM